MRVFASKESRPLHPVAQRHLENELKSGEALLWQSAPLARYLWPAVLPIVFFGIPWTAFIVFWMVQAAQGSALFALLGLPFLLVGCVMLAAPWWVTYQARRTAYALTTDRALILVLAPWGDGVSVRRYLPEELAACEREQRADGSGSIIFKREWVSGAKGRTHERKIGFIGVPAVQTVHLFVEELTRAHRASRPSS